MGELIVIPARRGKGSIVNKGQIIKLINTHGGQVVDTWAFNRSDLREFLSVEHCRPVVGGLMVKVGHSLVTNKRRPILTLVEDTSPGIHDMLYAACDRYRYEMLGCQEYHDNCTDNLASVFREMGLQQPETPCPLNIFQNSVPDPVTGVINLAPSVAAPGDYVTLRAEMDLLIVFSCCPMDITPVNGLMPREAHFQII